MRKYYSINIVLIVSLVCSLLNACAILHWNAQVNSQDDYFSDSGHVDGMKLNGKYIDLSRIFAIIPLYELADSTSKPKDRSQLVFLYKDGSYEIQNNQYMFQKGVAWTKKGIFYSDRKNDYFINAQTGIVKVTQHAKTEFEYATFALDDEHALTVYNKGNSIKNNGILSVSDVNGKFKEVSYTIGDELLMGLNVALCENGNTYDVGTAYNDDGTTYNVMYQLSDGVEPNYKRVHTLKKLSKSDFVMDSDVLEYTKNEPKVSISAGIGSQKAVCMNNAIYVGVTIGNEINTYDFDAKGHIKGIMKWDVETGKYSFCVFRSSKGDLLFSPYGDKWEEFYYTDRSLKDNHLIIESVDTGVIGDVDMETGILTEISSALASQDKWPIARGFLNSSDSAIYQTWIPINDNLGKHSFINVYSRETYKLVNTIKIDDSFTRYEQNDSVQPGFPVFNPDILNNS